MRLKKLISGGQTGVDRGALDAALEVGFPCGGWCPPGRAAEDGEIPARYPLTEMPGGGYPERTARNVTDSDATLVLYFGALHGGTRLTVTECERQGKPVLLIDAEHATPAQAAAEAGRFIAAHGVSVLNVAGPRISHCPGARAYARETISRLL